MPFNLNDPCQPNEDICSQIKDWTGSQEAANITDLVIGKPLALIGLFILLVVVRWVLHRLINRIVRRAVAVADARDHAASTRRAQRATTIGDLFRSIVTGVLVAIIGTMMLSEVGVDIAPIIASAGIIGIALGFGAQSLVKDFLSGVFMIVEDQYGVGDVIDAGEASGTVEAVSLRVTRLRDINGTVWYVPNGEILRVGNMSQNWSRAVVDVSVNYREDLARVKTVLGEIAHALWEDEDFRDLIIEEPEVTGVEQLGANSVNLRVMVKTLPMEQWGIARELRQRIKARFDHEGIQIPYAQQVIWRSEDARQSPAEQQTPGGGD